MVEQKRSRLQQRIEQVRRIPDSMIKEKIWDKTIYRELGMPDSKNRGKKSALNIVLVGAGKRPMVGTVWGDIAKAIAAGKFKKISETRREAFRAALLMLESAGILKRKFVKGGKIVGFSVVNKEKLRESIREGRIIQPRQRYRRRRR